MKREVVFFSRATYEGVHWFPVGFRATVLLFSIFFVHIYSNLTFFINFRTHS